MRVKRVFDGFELYPETKIDRELIATIWNQCRPKLKISSRKAGKIVIVTNKAGWKNKPPPPNYIIFAYTKET